MRCGEDSDDGCGCLQPKKIKKEGLATLFAEWDNVNGLNEADQDKLNMKLTPEIVLKIFRRISDDDVNFMGFSPVTNLGSGDNQRAEKSTRITSHTICSSIRTATDQPGILLSTCCVRYSIRFLIFLEIGFNNIYGDNIILTSLHSNDEEVRMILVTS